MTALSDLPSIVGAAFDSAFSPCDVPHRVRAFSPTGDMAIVMDSWRQSYRSARAMRGQNPDHYFPDMGAMIAEIVGRPDTEIVVACDVESPTMVLAWACVEGDTMHYAWTRVELRHQGLQKALLAGRRFAFASHYPVKGGLPEGMAYRPFLAWRGK